MNNNQLFPKLPLEAWEDTKKTLHLYLQVVGKVALKLAPFKNHWWHTTFRLNSRGLTTSNLVYEDKVFNVSFDFIDHKVLIQTSKGETKTIDLEPHLSVAEFYKTFFRHLDALDIKADILAKPYDNEYVNPFSVCTEHCTYDKEYVSLFWHILLQIGNIFEEFTSKFYGKVSPVQLFWHSFDLAVTRFSGRKAPKMPADARISDKEAYSHEVISAGFWAGDNNVREAAFYSYTYPLPEGMNKEELKPASAQWIESNGSTMAFLTYEAMRQSENPKQTLIDFLESSYKAGVKLAKWEIE